MMTKMMVTKTLFLTCLFIVLLGVNTILYSSDTDTSEVPFLFLFSTTYRSKLPFKIAVLEKVL